MKIRVKFAKYGSMKFIGHLDMMRYFQKAIRRADIDIRYSEGFSPHQIMSFAAPLGVGVESIGEYMDIDVIRMSSTEELKNSLSIVMVEGVEILDVICLPDTVKNAMASVTAAAYQIHFLKDMKITDFTEKVDAFFSKDVIPYTKETKKSVIELNLKEGIFELKANKIDVLSENMSAVAGILSVPGEYRSVPGLYMLLDASSRGNIKPSMVIERLAVYLKQEIKKEDYQITKLETYTTVKSEDTGCSHFVSLAEIG